MHIPLENHEFFSDDCTKYGLIFLYHNSLVNFRLVAYVVHQAESQAHSQALYGGSYQACTSDLHLFADSIGALLNFV
jgi:hypothetical protein